MISIFFLIVSRILKRNVKKTKEKCKIQQGKITYNDLIAPAKPLFSKKYMIAGKPDYIIKNNNQYIPVEFKSGNHSYPMKNHVLQLAAYCQLIEDNYNDFVPFGVLVYNNNSDFKIQFDPRTRYELENTIKKMRYTLRTGDISLNHNDSNRCKACSMKKYCNIKIF
jgi:CRISPR-associated protein Cas4